MVNVIPDDPDCHWKAGHYLGHRRGLWEPALKEFEKAGPSKESEPGFLMDRGLALLFTGADPLSDFRRAIEISIDKDKVIRKLAFYYLAARRVGDGQQFWKELEEAYPDLPGPAVNRAESELSASKERLEGPMLEMAGERMRALERARTSAEKSAVEEIYLNKGKAIWNEALKELDEYLRGRLEVFQEEPDLWRVSGESFQIQARYREAELSFRHAAEVGSKPLFWRTLITFLIAVREYEKAWKASIKAKGIFPEEKAFTALANHARDKMLAQKKD
jgi:tetratricopeptide (TPR) repeat protein